MPTQSLRLQAGVDTLRTPALNEAGISASNLIRFREGLVEKLGGWTKFYPFPFAGPPRALWPWQDLTNVGHLAVATPTSLSVITGGVNTFITPQTFSTSAATFSTTNGSPTVTVTDTGTATTVYDYVYITTQVAVGGLILSGYYAIVPINANSYTITASTNATSTTAVSALPAFTTASGQFSVSVALTAHGLSVGSTISFSPATTVGGLTISGFYTVKTVTNANTFSINAPSLASSAASATLNAGNPSLTYWVTNLPGSGSLGFGLGGFGSGGFGTGAVNASRAGSTITATDWTLGNFGEQLIACPKDGPILSWSPSGGFLSASLILNAPPINAGVLVADAQQMIIAWGSSVLGQQDPLLIRWCDNSNYNSWTASVTNQAGSYRLPTGSKIVGALATAQQILVWTDVDLWAMSYVGYPNVWGFNKIASGCGLIAPKAFAKIGNVVFWMSQKQFWGYAGGGASPLACTVRDNVFPVLDQANVANIRSAANSATNEVSWFYPAVGGSGENGNYVKYTVTAQCWDYGTMSRSAWADQSVLGLPIASSPLGYIYQHETSPDADGAPLLASFTTGWFMLSEGEDIPWVDLVHPDMKFGAPSTVSMTILVAGEASDTPVSYGPYPITQFTPAINTNCRGRMIALKFSSSDLGSIWRLGNMRYRYAPSGRQ